MELPIFMKIYVALPNLDIAPSLCMGGNLTSWSLPNNASPISLAIIEQPHFIIATNYLVGIRYKSSINGMDILTLLYMIDTFFTFLTRCIGYNKIDIIKHIMVRNWAKGTVHIL